MNKTVVTLMAISLFIAFSACGKKAEEKAAETAVEKLIEKSSGGQVKVDLSKEQIKIKDQHGEATISAGGNAQIPVDFPKDIYIYPNTKVLISQKVNGGFHLLLETGDVLEAPIKSYKEKMNNAGWKESYATSMGTTGIFTYEKENRKATVTISQSEKGKTGIQLQVSRP